MGRCIGVILLAVGLACTAPADEIIVGSESHKGVLVSVSKGEYVIQFPSTGKTLRASAKRKDVKLLSTSPPEEREKLIASWRMRSGPTPQEAPAPTQPQEKSTPEPSRRLSQQEWEQKRGQKAALAFETKLLLWAQLPEQLRQDIYLALAEEAEWTAESTLDRVAQLQSQREQNTESIEAHQEALQDVRSEAAKADAANRRAIARSRSTADSAARYVQNHSGTGWPNMLANIYNGAAENQFARGRNGSESRARAIEQERLRDSNQAAANAEIDQIYLDQKREESSIAHAGRQAARGYRARAGSIERDIGALESANGSARGDEFMVNMNAQDAIRRAESELQLLDTLDDALHNGYMPAYQFSAVKECHSESADDCTVSIATGHWRVFWGAQGAAAGTRSLSISVKDNGTGKRVAYSGDNVAAYERFLLIEGPGDFTVSMDAPANTACAVLIEAIESTE